MKTQSYNMDLMAPGQGNKEIVFNQAINKLDSLVNFYAQKLVSAVPSNLNIGEKYIISSNDGKDKICYHAEGKIQTIIAPEGIICFVKEKNNFYILENSKWQRVDLANAVSVATTSSVDTARMTSDIVGANEKFFGIDKKYALPVDAKNLYLYMNNNCELDFQKIQAREFTVIIKQNWQRTFNLVWPHNVLWASKQTHKLTQQANAVDIVKFYRLIETQHFIAEIIGQNYQF